MPNYETPDKFFDESQVEYGVGKGTESIRTNLKSTNGAAHRTEAAVAAVKTKVDAIHDFVTQTFKYENQPEGGEGTNNLITSQNATNGQVYRNADEIKAVRKELAELTALVKQALGSK